MTEKEILNLSAKVLRECIGFLSVGEDVNGHELADMVESLALPSVIGSCCWTEENVTGCNHWIDVELYNHIKENRDVFKYCHQCGKKINYR